MTLQKHNFLYFTASPTTIDKFSICAEPFHPFTARQETAASQPHTDYSRVDRVGNAALIDAKQP